MRNDLKRYLAEFLGSYMLVFFAAGAVVVSSKVGGLPGPVMGGMSSGLVLMIVIWTFADVSGAHVNPAYSLALVYLGRFPWRLLPGYIAAQFLGSGCAGLTLLWSLGDFGNMGANLPNAALGISPMMALGIETILSFIMMVVILGCGEAGHELGRLSAMPIGAIVGIEVMLFGPIAGAAMNPIRAFGPYLAMGDWTNFWVYVVGPLTGVMGATLLYQKALRRS